MARRAFRGAPGAWAGAYARSEPVRAFCRPVLAVYSIRRAFLAVSVRERQHSVADGVNGQHTDRRVWRLGFTRLAQCARESDHNYFAEGWAAVNLAGTRLWWQANDGVPVCDGDHEDVYQMIRPPPRPDTANPGGTLAAAGLSPDHIAAMPRRGPAMASWRVRPAAGSDGAGRAALASIVASYLPARTRLPCRPSSTSHGVPAYSGW